MKELRLKLIYIGIFFTILTGLNSIYCFGFEKGVLLIQSIVLAELFIYIIITNLKLGYICLFNFLYFSNMIHLFIFKFYVLKFILIFLQLCYQLIICLMIDSSKDELDICYICYDEYYSMSKISSTRTCTKHYFHTNCLLKWLRIKNICPLCGQ